MSKDKDPMVGNRKMPVLIALFAIIFIAIWIWWLWWPYPITTVYLSRHAEKLNATVNTPLSAAGELRAGKLAHVLKDEGIDVVFVTEFERTQKTGEPTALQAGVAMIQYDSGAPQDLVDTILADYAGEQVLVIGHSNTLDNIAAELGVSGVPELNETQFDRLFIVHRFGSSAHLNRLRYGLETP